MKFKYERPGLIDLMGAAQTAHGANCTNGSSAADGCMNGNKATYCCGAGTSVTYWWVSCCPGACYGNPCNCGTCDDPCSCGGSYSTYCHDGGNSQYCNPGASHTGYSCWSGGLIRP